MERHRAVEQRNDGTSSLHHHQQQPSLNNSATAYSATDFDVAVLPVVVVKQINDVHLLRSEVVLSYTVSMDATSCGGLATGCGETKRCRGTGWHERCCTVPIGWP